MQIFEWINNTILHIIRRFLQIVITFTVSLVCGIIYLVTYEPNTYRRVTKRKCRRIRVLTKFKLYVYKYFAPVCHFLHDDYMEQLYYNFNFLINK